MGQVVVVVVRVHVHTENSRMDDDPRQAENTWDYCKHYAEEKNPQPARYSLPIA